MKMKKYAVYYDTELRKFTQYRGRKGAGYVWGLLTDYYSDSQTVIPQCNFITGRGFSSKLEEVKDVRDYAKFNGISWKVSLPTIWE